MDSPLAVPRVIVLFDIDCFFCQVESKRDPSLKGKPFVVHQHEDLISISYEARALGIKKHETPDEAKRRVPAIILVSVPKGIGSKVSYQSYQQASERVRAVIASRTDDCPIERASIDEFYVDITTAVAESASLEDDLEELTPVPNSAPKDVYIEGGISVAYRTPVERKMMRASQLAHEIRREILTKEGLTVSAGIAHTKMLAKLASTLHKPNQQTVILLSATPRLLSEFPIRRVPGLSRLLRSGLSKDKLEGTLGSLLGRARAELCAEYGEAGSLLYDTARGVETSPVVPSGPPKSLSSSMSLTPVSTLPEVQRALGFAAKDLEMRLAADAGKFNRTAQTIIFRYRFVDAKEVGFNISARSLPTPSATQSAFADALVIASMAIFRKSNNRSSWQLRWISFTGTRFTAPTANGVDKLLRTQIQPPPSAAGAAVPSHEVKPVVRPRKPAAAPIELDDSEEESAEEGLADEKRSNKRQRD